MVMMSIYNYYLVVSAALIQFAVLSSFIYQIFKEARKPIDKDVGNVKVNKSSTVVNQLEFDTMSRSKEGAVDVNELIANINEDEIRVLSYLLSRGGDAYQAEIARELGLPKSTVSRIIRRLHDRGLITVRRVGRFSYVQVTDIDYVSDIISRLGPNKS
ncbi:helix-turn-helix transcriptional regulator [Vulcanisaeta distributa]|uniref:Transcriptional regulator, TrmB n=1 Tax=Vulcanisaeta distributa (strain DSM 14429 / JCM 11212 / NBRC 100878 / IC-017) TaxID=572478 RepID=E1QUJ4_VULDI|nr:MarR family transcriptional regulator [Vulcanisaeta distributa]ADN51113.1 transcriptional regulator, TrmB [Vulcanisaeta distributa DSM 14429]